MNIAVVDDVQQERENLVHLLRQALPHKGYQITLLHTFKNGETFLAQYKKGQYDLIFLDIYLEGLNGIEIAKEIRALDQTVKLIFITSSNEFASESYAVQANYYLLKPYSIQDLTLAIERLNLLEFQAMRTLVLPDGKEILLRCIVYTSFAGHYVTIHRTQGEPLQLRCTQKEFEKRILAYPDFVLCTKGMVVNLNETQRLESDRFLMKDGSYVPVSRRNYPTVQQQYAHFYIRKLREGVLV